MPSNQVPQHVAIIMDGNGRWACERGLPRNEGHQSGVENVRRIVEKAGQLGIRYLTLYAFSTENWNRPKPEVDALMALLQSFLKEQQQHLVKNKIRLHTIGCIEELPEPVRQQLQQTKDATAQFTDSNLVLALNYSSRAELVDSIKRYHTAVMSGDEQIEDLDWPHFQRYLHTGKFPDPELIIRTSGECRISNFLLLQSAYAEYFFSPLYWPDFGPDEFEKAIADFNRRERRFGRTSEQVRIQPTSDTPTHQAS